MSKIDQLINRLCPDGVEYRTLGSLEDAGLITLGRGKVISKKDIQNNPGDYPIYSSSATNNGLLGSYGDYMFDEELITWSIDGGGKFFYRPASRYSVTNVCGWLRVNDDQINTKYLYHTLLNEWHKKVFDYVHKAHPSTIRKEYAIPIPPLEVQSEIVRILDSFTELSAELTAELAFREKQYDYYSRSLLSFDEHTPRRKLGDIIKFTNGKGHEKNIVADGKYTVVNSKFISTDGAVRKYSNVQMCPVFIDDILMVMSDLPNGKALAKCYLVEEDEVYTLNQRIGCFHVRDEHVIKTKFLYYVLNRNRQLLRYDNGVDQTNLRKNDILDIDIPVPNLKTQKKIIRILDSFGAVCKDTSSGLPAEIEARNKQYEFYRNKLLSFSELKAA